MRDVIRSDEVEIKSFTCQQIIIRGNGNSEFNNTLNKLFKLLPPIDNLRIVSNEEIILSKLSFDQWNLIFTKEISEEKIIKYIEKLNNVSSILATNLSDAQIFFQIKGRNANQTLNKLTHFDFREKSFKSLTAAQSLLARIDCTFLKFSDHLLIGCNRSFGDYLEDRLIDAVNF
tara:strand:+ start:8069 stop:8590 length:522 start_codon:yes stop_codon:yes gene_type:complete